MCNDCDWSEWRVEQLDVHMKNNSIYWCGKNSTSGGGIYRVHPDGSGFTDVVSTGIGRRGIRGIAVDWVASKYPGHRGVVVINRTFSQQGLSCDCHVRYFEPHRGSCG